MEGFVSGFAHHAVEDNRIRHLGVVDLIIVLGELDKSVNVANDFVVAQDEVRPGVMHEGRKAIADQLVDLQPVVDLDRRRQGHGGAVIELVRYFLRGRSRRGGEEGRTQVR